MESAGPGGARAHDFRGLDLALGVNGADDDLVGAGLGRGPIVVPDHPGKWGERQLERRVLPGPFAVETDLDLLDGLRPSEGDAFEQVLLPAENLVMTGAVNACRNLDRAVIGPAFPLPVALVV